MPKILTNNFKSTMGRQKNLTESSWISVVNATARSLQLRESIWPRSCVSSVSVGRVKWMIWEERTWSRCWDWCFLPLC